MQKIKPHGLLYVLALCLLGIASLFIFSMSFTGHSLDTVYAHPGTPDPDSDGDGIPNDADACPSQRGPLANGGCPFVNDDDGDGTTNDLDQCPLQGGPNWNGGCPSEASAPPASTTNTATTTTNSAPPPVNNFAGRVALPTNPSVCTIIPTRAYRSTNVREAPGTEFKIIDELNDRSTYEPVAQGTEAKGLVWYLLPSGGWVADRAVDKTGPCESLPQASDDPTMAFLPSRVAISALNAQDLTQVGQLDFPSLISMRMGFTDGTLAVSSDSQLMFYPTNSIKELKPQSIVQLNEGENLEAMALTSAMFVTSDGDLFRVITRDGSQLGNPAPVAFTTADMGMGPIVAANSLFTVDVVSIVNIVGGLTTDLAHENQVVNLIFLPNGTRIITYMRDGQIGIWNAFDGSLLATLDTAFGEGDQASMAVSIDGRRLVVGSPNGQVQIVNMADQTLGLAFETTIPISALALNADASLLAIAGTDQTLAIFDANDGTQLARFNNLAGALTRLYFTIDNTLLVGSDATSIHLWATQ